MWSAEDIKTTNLQICKSANMQETYLHWELVAELLLDVVVDSDLAAAVEAVEVYPEAEAVHVDAEVEAVEVQPEVEAADLLYKKETKIISYNKKETK